MLKEFPMGDLNIEILVKCYTHIPKCFNGEAHNRMGLAFKLHILIIWLLFLS